MNKVTRNRVIAGIASAALVAGGGLFVHKQATPNQCEAIIVENTELFEIATEYVEVTDNIITLGGALQPILSDLNRNNLDLKRNGCKGQVRDRYMDTFEEAYDDYREAVLSRYPFMTNWL